jgi:hypothetical protein
MTKARVSLAEFAKDRKRPGKLCWTCGIPEAQEINQARGKVAVSAIVKWLVVERGYPKEEATPSRIENHFQREHTTR